MKRTTVRQLFEQWAKVVMPFGAPEIQRQEMERAFYAGAFALFHNQITEVAAMDYAEAEVALTATRDEFEAYFVTLGKIPRSGTERN